MCRSSNPSRKLLSNPDSYRTLASQGSAELVVERSRFIGFARPIETLEEGLAFVEELRAQYHAARHVCFGLRVGRGSQTVDRSNDDGEPARTGGFPLWQLLEGEDVVDAMIAVVRYFGGIKLGGGGLVRAYSDAVAQAVEAAGTRTVPFSGAPGAPPASWWVTCRSKSRTNREPLEAVPPTRNRTNRPFAATWFRPETAGGVRPPWVEPDSLAR